MTTVQTDERRHDLDALRVFCFGTLIIYHSSLVYGAKSWWIHSSDTSTLIDLIALASHPRSVAPARHSCFHPLC